MIVHPDFLDHRKTRKLIALSGDDRSPFWVLRLWAYCQRQRKSVFDDLASAHLADVCHAPISGDQLLTFLLDSGFVRMAGQTLTVHDWDEVNRMLVSAWANGQKGGAPTRSANRSGRSVNRSDNQSTRARVGEEDKIRAGYPVGSDRKAPEQPAKAGPLAGGIRAGKLCLLENSEQPSADDRRRAALREFGGLAKAVANSLTPPDNS